MPYSLDKFPVFVRKSAYITLSVVDENENKNKNKNIPEFTWFRPDNSSEATTYFREREGPGMRSSVKIYDVCVFVLILILNEHFHYYFLLSLLFLMFIHNIHTTYLCNSIQIVCRMILPDHQNR